MGSHNCVNGFCIVLWGGVHQMRTRAQMGHVNTAEKCSCPVAQVQMGCTNRQKLLTTTPVPGQIHANCGNVDTICVSVSVSVSANSSNGSEHQHKQEHK